MKTLRTLLTTATLLSISPIMAANASPSADCPKAPVTRAGDLVAAIDHQGHATPTVVFERGTAKLAPASRDQLEELAKLLDDESDLRIQVGFAAEGNVSPELAKARAKALREALLDLDAPANRVALRETSGQAEIAKVEIANGPAQCVAPVAGS